MIKQTLCLSGVHYRDSEDTLLFLEDEENGNTYQVLMSDFPTTPLVDHLKSQDAFTIGYLFCHNSMLQE
jgi:hypothetical protein